VKKKEITITISELGEIMAETNGVKGEACLDYIEVLESLLGAQTIDSNLTDEYYEGAQEQVSARQELYRNE
jgi:hypothetical protein